MLYIVTGSFVDYSVNSFAPYLVRHGEETFSRPFMCIYLPTLPHYTAHYTHATPTTTHSRTWRGRHRLPDRLDTLIWVATPPCGLATRVLLSLRRLPHVGRTRAWRNARLQSHHPASRCAGLWRPTTDVRIAGRREAGKDFAAAPLLYYFVILTLRLAKRKAAVALDDKAGQAQHAT